MWVNRKYQKNLRKNATSLPRDRPLPLTAIRAPLRRRTGAQQNNQRIQTT